MYIGDIIGMLLVCAVIMLPAGFLARDYLPTFGRWFSAHFLKPRYLQAQGLHKSSPHASAPLEKHHE